MTAPATTSPRRSSGLPVAQIVIWVILGLVAAWILIFATGTSAGPAVEEPGEFLVTLLDGLTFASLLFVVASGFTLIFGLMRTVNMAHGSLFLLAAYVAIELQQTMVGKERNIEAADVSILSWIVPVLIGGLLAALVGLVMHQLLLRWNQGQDLRQALITVAISVILADQMLARFGGLANNVTWPGAVTHFFEILGERYPTTRLFMATIGVVVGILLYLWLAKTRMGMVIRAGVDDQDMVRALGINIQVAFAMVFLVGAFLAGIGGVMGASFAGAAPGKDGEWLLNSLFVVIIGGLGSIKGAAAGALLFGLLLAFGPAYLPLQYSFYSAILTFVLLAAVLVLRPNGLYGAPTS